MRQSPIPPARRPDLFLRPLGDDGQHIVKDLRTGAFFNLGPVESFLLLRLDGKQSVEVICSAFEEQFGESLSEEDLDEFLDLVRERGLLQSGGGPGAAIEDEPDRADPDEICTAPHNRLVPTSPDSTPPPPEGSAAPRPRQSLLYWRKRFFDPDRLFNWLEPRLWFVWTRTFFALSAGAIVAATWVVWGERQALVTQFPHMLRWETLLLAWLTLVAVTTCHEFAHGLTCKHHGGEVHELGFLLMYGLPCFFCNVSDAWLIREKWKRLWVTLAGGYCDLVFWALAVFAWRLTPPDSLPNYIAWVVLSICGVRVFFNFNPLLKLDGYYLLSDGLEIPNLRQRAWDSWMGHLRWALWGAPRPGRQARGRFLLGFGAACWLYAFILLGLILTGLRGLLGGRGGIVGIGWLAVLGVAMVRGQFQGFTNGEVIRMIRARRKRTVLWAMALTALGLVLAHGRMEDRAGGEFTIYSRGRSEVRAPVAGFLRAVEGDEGDRVSPGGPVARLEVPELASRIAQKRAEVREAEARVLHSEVGPRPEEVAEQRARVGRGEAWRDLAARDLDRACQALREEMTQLDEVVAQARAEHDSALEAYNRAKVLLGRSALSHEEFREAEKKRQVCQSQLREAEARQRARRAEGTLVAEAELALREQQLAEARSALCLLEAGTRPEEIAAERAHLARLEEEARYLEGLRDRVLITSPVGGVIATPRLREKVGQYLREGDLICEVEVPEALEADVALVEQDAERIRPGFRVELKARSLPFETIRARVDRIAPRAAKAEKTDVQAKLSVYCRLGDGTWRLRPGMTGHARIACGRKPIGEILYNSVLRVVRTEFWW